MVKVSNPLYLAIPGNLETLKKHLNPGKDSQLIDMFNQATKMRNLCLSSLGVTALAINQYGKTSSNTFGKDLTFLGIIILGLSVNLLGTYFLQHVGTVLEKEVNKSLLPHYQ